MYTSVGVCFRKTGDNFKGGSWGDFAGDLVHTAITNK